VVPPAEPEIPGFKNILLVTIIHNHRARYLVSEYIIGYKLLPFPATRNVAGISEGQRPFMEWWHQE